MLYIVGYNAYSEMKVRQTMVTLYNGIPALDILNLKQQWPTVALFLDPRIEDDYTVLLKPPVNGYSSLPEDRFARPFPLPFQLNNSGLPGLYLGWGNGLNTVWNEKLKIIDCGGLNAVDARVDVSGENTPDINYTLEFSNDLRLKRYLQVTGLTGKSLTIKRLTINNSEIVSDTTTVSVGTQTYTYVDASPSANEILIGANSNATASNTRTKLLADLVGESGELTNVRIGLSGNNEGNVLTLSGLSNGSDFTLSTNNTDALEILTLQNGNKEVSLRGGNATKVAYPLLEIRGNKNISNPADYYYCRLWFRVVITPPDELINELPLIYNFKAKALRGIDLDGDYLTNNAFFSDWYVNPSGQLIDEGDVEDRLSLANNFGTTDNE